MFIYSMCVEFIFHMNPRNANLAGTLVIIVIVRELASRICLVSNGLGLKSCQLNNIKNDVAK